MNDGGGRRPAKLGCNEPQARVAVALRATVESESASRRPRCTECNGYPGGKAPPPGTAAATGRGRDGSHKRGFTLIEMILVLVIIAILAATAMPAFSSAVNEHRVRDDGHQLAMMVRQAMVQSAEQHRTYILDLTKNTMTLHAQGDEVQADDDTTARLFQDSGSNETNSDQPLADAVTPNIDVEHALDSPNKLQVPDTSKSDSWMDVPNEGVEWIFQPGELCPAQKVRIVRGDAFLEMDFAALTGGIDTEKYYFP